MSHIPENLARIEHVFERIERELAAILRQHQRATIAGDESAKLVEAEAAIDRIRWLLYHHLDLRVGISSDNWVWLDGQADCAVEPLEPWQFRTLGRITCSLPEGRRREWFEPFEAQVSLSPSSGELSTYTIRFANVTTIQNLQKVAEMIEAGEAVKPRIPVRSEEWAYTFRMGERS
jgi:hypothetical protein